MPKIVKNNTVYAAVPSSASGIAYNGTTSGISANTVQGAIDEVVEEKADRVPEPTEYSATSTYAKGDLVTYNNNIYQCKTAISTAEAWNSDHWTLVTPDTDYLHSINPNGNGSFSLNRKDNTTVGRCSFAEGYCTTASGNYSHAEGYCTTASGYGSHAEGWYTTASGYYPHAEGCNCTASGQSSHAEGEDTLASGDYSHAEGHYTTANHRSQHTFGEYNILDNSTAGASSRGNYIEIVGNGTGSSAKSNARTLDWSGNEVLAGTLTATGLNLTGSITDAVLTSPRCEIASIQQSKCYQIGNIIFYSAEFTFGSTIQTAGAVFLNLNKVAQADFCWGSLFYDTGDTIYKVAKGYQTPLWVTNGTTRTQCSDVVGKSRMFVNLTIIKAS